MSEAKSKLFSVGEIIPAFVYCLITSFFIYSASVIYIFGAWHCPEGNCQTSTLVNATIFLILASPFLVFIAGAYFCRNAVYALTKSKIWRAIMLLAFALFPLYLIIGFIIYAVTSPN